MLLVLLGILIYKFCKRKENLMLVNNESTLREPDESRNEPDKFDEIKVEK